jgi:hypothetical protein
MTRIFFLLFLGVCTIAFSYGQRNQKNAIPPSTLPDTTKPKPPAPVVEKTKGSKKLPGLFTLYQDTINGSLQMYVRKNQLGKEYIYQSFALSGPTSLYLNQSMHRMTFIFKVQKVFDKLEFATANVNFYYDSLNAISRAANVDVPEAIFHADKISAEDPDGYLVPIDGLLISEKLDPVRPIILPGSPPGAFFTLGNLNAAKSKYSKVRSYPDNTDVIVDLAYDNPTPFNPGGRDITDPRYVRIRMQHTFLEIPQNDFKPRYDDPRVGYFTTQTEDLTALDPTKRYKDKIARWHLKKKDPNAAISEPVQPIVYWIENTTPVEQREIIKEAGLKWNEAFEKAGFQNAIQMRIMPDTATWDPSDVRYNVIRWVSSMYRPYGAIGPSFVNPKTGQILGADITVELGVLNPFFDELYLGGTVSIDKLQAIFHRDYQPCTMAEHFGTQLAGLFSVSEKKELVDDLKEIQKQFMYFLILHEMGHTLGLNHNMKASHLWSPKEIHNKELTRKYGLYGSVMDYPAVNLALDPKKQGDYYTTKVGPYDIWAIQYGYTPASNETEEKKILAEILSKSTDPRHAFGNDADDMRSPGKAIDPRVQVNDLTNDPLTYAEERYGVVKNRMSNLLKRYPRSGSSYYDIYYGFGIYNNLRAQMTSAVSRYIGGVYIDRSFPEQKSGNKPFTPVPVATQKKAMAILSKYLFAPDAFKGEEEIYPYIQQLRRGFNFFTTTEDPKLTDIYRNLQFNTTLSHLLHPVTLQRMTNSRLYGNQYSTADMMGDLTKAIFEADLKTGVNIFRQNLQTEYVKQLTSIASPKTISPPYDNISRAAALYSIRRIRAQMQTAVSPNEETRAHRANIIFLIDEILDRK